MYRNLYTALFSLLLPVYFLRLCWKGLSNREYLYRWSERLGLSKNKPSVGKNIIWIHAVSVGEVNASMSLLRKLIEDFPNFEILVTTTTPTGSKLLLEKLAGKIKHQYLPVDIPFFINLFLKRWKPKMMVLIETEIWPNLISICKKEGVYSALVNARLSEKSKINYLKYSALIRPALDSLDLILAQFESDKSRFTEITAKEINLCGNLKFDQKIPEELYEISKSIRQSWAIDGKFRPTLIASSTHEGEEEIILDAFKKIHKKLPNSLLILVPRHFERFNQVKRIIKNSGLSFATRSKKSEVANNVQVLLGDTIGELNFLYSLADVAFVGGSLIDHGGQNLLEPSAQSMALLSGPSLRNFSDISDQLIANKALKLVNDAEDISNEFLKLIKDELSLEARGKAALDVFNMNRGALDIIFDNISNLLKT
tara:strand:- start:310 stop:1587 length:1278 start_codon:yes stop_codon:yes gene_type:complete